MPLRDHFRPPLDDETSWEGFHSGWPMMIVAGLAAELPKQFVAEPRVHWGASVEIDVATYEKDPELASTTNEGESLGRSVATASWSPPAATLAVTANLPAQDEFGVRVYDTRRGRKLVAAVEIVSPANKDRQEHRRAFVAKCAALLQEQVSVAIVDLITTRHFNLYGELLEFIGQRDPLLEPEPPSTYAVACRGTRRGGDWFLETWMHDLKVGKPLPTLPLWLADDLSVPLELEASYQQTCQILRLR